MLGRRTVRASCFGSAAGCARVLASAPPPDVRRGYASPEVFRKNDRGSAPGMASGPKGRARTWGIAPVDLIAPPARRSLAAHPAAEPKPRLPHIRGVAAPAAEPVNKTFGGKAVRLLKVLALPAIAGLGNFIGGFALFTLLSVYLD